MEMLVRFFLNKDKLMSTTNTIKLLGGLDVVKEFVPSILLDNKVFLIKMLRDS